MQKTTKIGYAIAAHLGMDGDDFESQYRYQPTRWTKPVYAIGNDYWSAGSKPPNPTQGRRSDFEWQKVVSAYDRETVLWLSAED